jgi:hypothetical protein
LTTITSDLSKRHLAEPGASSAPRAQRLSSFRVGVSCVSERAWTLSMDVGPKCLVRFAARL